MSSFPEKNEYETFGIQNKDEMSKQSNLLTNVSNKLFSAEKNNREHFLLQYSDIFVGSDGKLGRTDLTADKINTGDAKPIKLPPRTITKISARYC